MTNLYPLGKVVRLQIQRSSLKVGEKPNRWYDTAPLWPVPELTLTSGGALAQLPNGESTPDVHHAAHPQSKNNQGKNGISIGFTAHYAAMQERFGAQVAEGCAGENILVATEKKVTSEMLSAGLAIQTTTGLAWLQEVSVAAPCKTFSKYLSGSSEPEIIKQTLQFLDNGTRGFYCVLAHDNAVKIAVGDEVLLLKG